MLSKAVLSTIIIKIHEYNILNFSFYLCRFNCLSETDCRENSRDSEELDLVLQTDK
jgi:hypothetical protein